jgi:thiol-disulfide isomerase/thioredoxin
MNAVQLTRRLRPLVWALAALALVAILVWRAAAPNPSTQGGSQERPVTLDDTKPGVDLYPTGERLDAPTLAGPTLDGKQLALSDLAGNIVVINVWGSWCAPCRAETPDLVRLANEYASRDVRFVGINTRDNPAAAKAFVRNFNVPYPSIEDAEGLLLLNFRDTIPTTVLPTTVVIDRQGRIAARVIGPVTYNTLKGLLDDELAAERGGR